MSGAHTYSGIYRALVEDNNDPLKKGRVRLRVMPMMEGAAKEHLPWATMASPIVSVAGEGHGWFAIPCVNSWVFCFFEGCDIYQPVFFAEASSGVHGQVAQINDYPGGKRIVTKSGCSVQLSDSKPVIELAHPSGSVVRIDEDGNVEIGTAGKSVRIRGSVVVEGRMDVEGSMGVEGSMNVEGAVRAENGTRVALEGHSHE